MKQIADSNIPNYEDKDDRGVDSSVIFGNEVLGLCSYLGVTIEFHPKEYFPVIAF